MPRFLRALACVFSLLAAPVLFADEPWDKPFAADPKAMLEAAQAINADDAGVVMLLDEARYTFDEKGRSTLAEHVVYRVANESGIERYSTIDALWAPWYQEKPELKARVIAKDGSVHELDAASLTETAAPEESLDIFSDNRVLRAPLPAVQVGSVVEQLITYKDKSPMDAGATGRYFFGRYVPVHHARLVLDAPMGLSVRIVNRTAPVIEPKKETVDGRQRTIYELSDLKAIEWMEFNLPFDQSARPYVAFSTGKSWQDVAQRYSEIVDKQIAGSSATLSPLVKAAAAGSSKRADIVAQILAEIQKNVRYAGVEVGEGSVIPRPPQEVLGHKYGDCKDKATLLVAMLREAGIPAHVALLRAGDDLDAANELPGFGDFNHAIVVVGDLDKGEKPLWVDPTDEFARPGELPVMDQGRHALIAAPKTATLTETPMSDSSFNHITETRVVNLVEEGKASITETTEATGADDSFARHFYTQSDRKRYHDAMEKYVQGHYMAKELKNITASDPHDLSKPFSLKLDIAEAGRAPTEDGEAVVAIFPVALVDSLPWSLKQWEDESDDKPKKLRKREHDFLFSMPYTKEWRYHVIPPQGFSPRPLPPNETSKLGTATLTKNYTLQNDGSILATIKFDSGKRRISASEFEELRKAVHELGETKAVVIGFDATGEAKLSSGDVGGALTEFRKLSDLHPKEARHHADVARALLAGGMGDAAREEIRKAIEIEPDYPRAYFVKGVIFEHDLFSRRFRKGFDLKTSIEAFKKAKELKARDVQTRAELAKLYQFGEDGSLFGRGSDVSASIDEYKAIQKDLDDDRLEGDLLLALANAGRFEEMRTLARSAKDTDQRDLATVVAAGALEGTAGAMRALNALDQNQRKKMMESAGGTLATLRFYSVAADLLDQAAQNSSKAAELRGQVDLLRKAKKIDPSTMSEADPKAVVQKMFAEVFLNSDLHQVGKYFASDLQASLLFDPQDENEPQATLSSLRANLGKDDVSLQFLIDMTFAGLQFQQDGDDATGYRVRMRNSSSENSEAMYVIKEGSKYRLSGYSRLPEMIGFRALRLAAAGDLDKARRWLNWEREDVSGGNGDDPLAGSPFAHLWAKGKQSATADEIRVAAASLMLRKPFLAEALPILTAARETAKEDKQAAIDCALAIAYAGAHQWNDMETVSRRLVAAQPDSLFAFGMLTQALSEKGQTAEAMKLAQTRLSKLPNDSDAIRALAGTAMRAGDYRTSDDWYRKLIEATTANSGDYNNAAWNLLFIGKDLDRALEDARRATALPGGSTPAALHTLATLYAETGKTIEARDALLKSMDDAGRDDPAPHDWYVLGRIAEDYGATDAAIAAYKRVDKPNESLAGSTYVLAQKRLSGLKK